ncbi:AzlC family ABC transporter permease [Corynebacterium lubricantis]|uniref:AzlC family ABC transporter permease n=1 Tax=Corynebacterium lubricantis TaxID=541095 RepID=UPI0003A00CA2|nr:AzlC family ABC transporter permease [Corynebacterium lubricantis]
MAPSPEPRKPSESRTTTLNEVKLGVKDTLVAGIGLVPLGLAFGLLMTQSGFAWWWTPIFSIVIYAGSMEFLAINMVTSGVGPVSAAITGFMVNFRHIFYGLTFPRHRIKSRLGRAYSTYALTDESYGIVSALDAKEPISGTRALTIQIVCQSLWAIPGIIGGLVGEIIPAGLEGMDFALTALFVVLAWDSFQNNKDYSLPFIAATLAVIVGIFFPNSILIIALLAYFAILLVRYLSPRIDDLLTWRAKGDRI